MQVLSGISNSKEVASSNRGSKLKQQKKTITKSWASKETRLRPSSKKLSKSLPSSTTLTRIQVILRAQRRSFSRLQTPTKSWATLKSVVFMINKVQKAFVSMNNVKANKVGSNSTTRALTISFPTSFSKVMEVAVDNISTLEADSSNNSSNKR